MSNMLVIGGTGFIGSCVTEEAVKRGFAVTSISKNIVGKDQQKHLVKYIAVDIGNKNELALKLKENKFQYVINVSGYVDHAGYFVGGKDVVDTHLFGVINLLDFLDKSEIVKFVQIGSSDEYGDNDSPQNEAQRELPISPYSFAKTAVTHFLQMLYRTIGLPTVVIRPFLIYGPGQNSGRFIPHVIKGCISKKDFPVSKGDQIRDFCYITDFVDAVFLTLDNKRANGKVLNIASGKPVMIKDVVSKIAFYVGYGKPIFGGVNYRNNENMNLHADISQARDILGWEPKVNLDNGLKNTVNWFKIKG